MLIRKLERNRADKFLGDTRDPESPLADETDEERLSAFIGERCAPHRGRPTNPDAVVHNLITNGFTHDAVRGSMYRGDDIPTNPAFNF